MSQGEKKEKSFLMNLLVGFSDDFDTKTYVVQTTYIKTTMLYISYQVFENNEHSLYINIRLGDIFIIKLNQYHIFPVADYLINILGFC